MMPAQRPGASRQDYGTPRELLDAVRSRFGTITVDLAAHVRNRVAPDWIGPERDSLAQDWTRYGGLLWLNPPFAKIAPWAAKCAASVGPTRTILLLTPASIGSRWFVDHVWRRALVIALVPRLTFDGCDTPYPKDCMLSVYGHDPGFDVWEWR